MLSVHTDSLPYAPSWCAASVVPPTPVTSGLEAGTLTPRFPPTLRFPVAAPVSPEDAKTLTCRSRA